MEILSNGIYEYRMDENANNVKTLKQIFGEKAKTPLGYSIGFR